MRVSGGGGLLIKVSSTQHGEGVEPAAAGGDTTHSRGPPRGEGGRGGVGGVFRVYPTPSTKPSHTCVILVLLVLYATQTVRAG